MEIASNQINKYYDILEETKTDIGLSKKPYIPTNFKYVDGEWNTGFVIEDENKNQFVWVPCSNEKNDENIPILSRYIFSSSSFCIEEADIVEFLKSSLGNGGFYISRYEIGKENEIAVSKAGCEIWTDVTVDEAKKISKNMYSNINSRLINGYSYDTAVKFIQDEIDEDNISSSSGKTGNKEYKNIYDLVDDLGEWTEEERDGFQIYRKTIIGNEVKYLADRLSESEKYKAENIGFRTIIYK